MHQHHHLEVFAAHRQRCGHAGPGGEPGNHGELVARELLEEERHEGDDVALLLQTLCGTRDVSANFYEEVRKVLTKASSREAMVERLDWC